MFPLKPALLRGVKACTGTASGRSRTTLNRLSRMPKLARPAAHTCWSVSRTVPCVSITLLKPKPSEAQSACQASSSARSSRSSASGRRLAGPWSTSR